MDPATVGILVVAYARPALLELVLESLRRQGAIGRTHVWIDGTADRMEMTARPNECAEVARRHEVAEIRSHRGHLGIEKLMLDGLATMSRRYQGIIVLEDDCFPTGQAVEAFTSLLDRVAQPGAIFSVYGHHFRTPREAELNTRFQGWGWATTSRRLEPVLARARELFLLPEKEYLEFTHRSLDAELVAKLDVTPGRNVCEVARRFYSWDSCVALLTAQAGLQHLRTPAQVVYNCGIGGGVGHFPDAERLRQPPFNMIRPDEAWGVY